MPDQNISRENPSQYVSKPAISRRNTILFSYAAVMAIKKSAEEVKWALTTGKPEYAARGTINLIGAAAAAPISTVLQVLHIPVAGAVINKVIRLGERNLNPRLIKAKKIIPKENDESDFYFDQCMNLVEPGAKITGRLVQRVVTKAIKNAVDVGAEGLELKASGLGHFMETVDRTWEAVEGYSRGALQKMFEEIPKLRSLIKILETSAENVWKDMEKDVRFWKMIGEDVSDIDKVTNEALLEHGIPKALLLKWETWQYEGLTSPGMLVGYLRSLAGSEGGMIRPGTICSTARKAVRELDELEDVIGKRLYPYYKSRH